MSDILELIVDMGNIRNNIELVESMFNEGSTAATASAVYRILENQDEILEHCERTDNNVLILRQQLDAFLIRLTDALQMMRAADATGAHAELYDTNQSPEDANK